MATKLSELPAITSQLWPTVFNLLWLPIYSITPIKKNNLLTVYFININHQSDITSTQFNRKIPKVGSHYLRKLILMTFDHVSETFSCPLMILRLFVECFENLWEKTRTFIKHGAWIFYMCQNIEEFWDILRKNYHFWDFFEHFVDFFNISNWQLATKWVQKKLKLKWWWE